MDPFQRLPAELVGQILQDTADFAGVDSLISVSLHARATFQANSCTIFQGLVSSNSITSQPEIKKLLSSIALIHHPSICCTSLDQYMQLTNGEEGALESALCQQNSGLACRIFRIAAQTQRLACTCLSTLRQGLVTAVGTSPIRTKKATEPFSYIEEYRVYWALWLLRCYSDLRKAVDSRSTGPNWIWSRDEINKLDAYATLNGIHSFRAEQIWTVASILVELGPRLASPSTGESIELPHPSTAAWDLAPNTPIPFFSSFELSQSIEKEYSRLWCPPQAHIENPVTRAWFMTSHHFDRPAGQTMFFRFLSNQCLRGRPGRPRSAAMKDISPYRRSGVFLWDSWRMYSIGLQPNTSRERKPVPGGGFIEPRDRDIDTTDDYMSNWLEIAGVKQ